MNSTRDENILRDALQYLTQIQTLYQSGIPAEALAVKPGKSVMVLFVIHDFEAKNPDGSCRFEGPQGELLAGAITKGLKLDISEAAFFQYGPGKSFEEAISNARNAVFLGRKVTALAFPQASFEDQRGTLVDYKGRPSLITHDIEDVLSSAAIKKEFWLDLQKLK
jgi:hypothetical protein